MHPKQGQAELCRGGWQPKGVLPWPQPLSDHQLSYLFQAVFCSSPVNRPSQRPLHGGRKKWLTSKCLFCLKTEISPSHQLPTLSHLNDRSVALSTADAAGGIPAWGTKVSNKFWLRSSRNGFPQPHCIPVETNPLFLWYQEHSSALCSAFGTICKHHQGQMGQHTVRTLPFRDDR